MWMLLIARRVGSNQTQKASYFRPNAVSNAFVLLAKNRDFGDNGEMKSTPKQFKL
jgi:hypothetical protein